MSEEIPYNAGDPNQVKKRKSKASLARAAEEAENEYLIGSYNGRAFVWRLLSECGIQHMADHDMVAAYRFEGRRDVGIWVQKELFASNPRAHMQMTEEAMERKEKK